jgi:putative ATP-dependent endonuclease of OLD family
MHVSELVLHNFRSCRQARILLQPEVTMLVGENNGGKTSAVDALRLLTEPHDGRRSRWPEKQDLFAHCEDSEAVRLEVTLADIGPLQAALTWRRCCRGSTTTSFVEPSGA